MKLTGIKISGNFKIAKDGRVERDEAAAAAKLDLCTRLKRNGSKKVRVVRPSS